MGSSAGGGSSTSPLILVSFSLYAPRFSLLYALAEGFREELNSHRARQGVVALLPPLWTDRSAFQQDLDSAGYREGEVNQKEYWTTISQ